MKLRFSVLATFMGVFFMSNIALAQQFTILPGTQKNEEECGSILNSFELSGHIPNGSAAAASATAEGAKSKAESDYKAADEAYSEQVQKIEELYGVGGASACSDSGVGAGSSACKDFNDSYQKYNDSAVAKTKADNDAESAAQALKDMQPAGSDREDLLGCAIKTGRISLQMIPYFISYISNFFLSLVGLICVLFIVLGGYQYIAGGLTEAKEKGKKYIYHALLGMAVATLSWIIVNLVMGALTS